MIASDIKGNVTFLNPVAENLTGWSMAEAVGKPVKEVFDIVNEETRATVDDPVSKVLQSGMIVGLANHTVLLKKGGGEVPIDDSGAPIRDEEGNILGVILVFRDISERRLAEKAQKTIQGAPGAAGPGGGTAASLRKSAGNRRGFMPAGDETYRLPVLFQLSCRRTRKADAPECLRRHSR